MLAGGKAVGLLVPGIRRRDYWQGRVKETSPKVLVLAKNLWDRMHWQDQICASLPESSYGSSGIVEQLERNG